MHIAAAILGITAGSSPDFISRWFYPWRNRAIYINDVEAMRGHEKLKLWVAQGFGIGRIPVAPGTFGSILGLLWFALLLATGKCLTLVLGSFASVALSVWLCGAGERLLGKKDPGSVVLDEVAAMPICFFSWVGLFLAKNGALPTAAEVFSRHHWLLIAGVFAAFRFFDVVKPWPVRQSQSLPGGWGITVDDVLAAVYVNLVVLALNAARPLL